MFASEFSPQVVHKHFRFTDLLEQQLTSKLYFLLFTDFQKLPPKVRSAVRELEKETAQCTGFLVNICLSYGSRAEIVMACNAAVAEKYEIEQCRINREHMSSIGGVEIAKCKAKKVKSGVRESSSTSTTLSPSVGEENVCASSPPADCSQGPNSSSTIKALGLEPKREKNYDDVNSEFTEIENHIGTTDPGERGCSSSSSSSSSGSRGGDLGPGSELSSDCKSSKFCDAHQKTSVKFLELDDEVLSRHMCTAHIPGNERK
jgi:Putative undecaprenyl diphosphate synthase